MRHLVVHVGSSSRSSSRWRVYKCIYMCAFRVVSIGGVLGNCLSIKFGVLMAFCDMGDVVIRDAAC